MRTVVFSPHMDDAVLSASVCLLRPGTEVVTVFAGPPSPATGLTHWDRLTRARSSADRHTARLAEDDRAMSLLGVPFQRLDEVDNQYRQGDLDLDALAGRLADLADGADEVWAPAAVGGHPDHVAVRDAVRTGLRERNVEVPVVVYADQPYSLWAGWPTWLTGRPAPGHLDPDYWLDNELAEQCFRPAELIREAVELTADQRRRKSEAVQAYRSQLAALWLDPADTRRWESFLSYEIAWRLSAGAPAIRTDSVLVSSV
ncbi:PIG-L deacetylase family protein [Streptomyces sp. NPDC001339]|uniref:PIG-L deacetylase family protein n=1 Tax=Streptomyces sp. NPDC001339 TaxID=3364563 RepID=UPI0036BF170D